MGIEDTARALMVQLGTERNLISQREWKLQQMFHRLRLARVGASGIQHRVMETEADVLAELDALVQEML